MMDDTAISELAPEALASFRTAAEEGAQLRDMCRTPAWKRLQERIEAKVSDSRNAWLKASNKETAEVIRMKASVWKDVLDMILKDLVRGDGARQILGRHAEISKDSSSDNKGE